jgi:hypothetical protein
MPDARYAVCRNCGGHRDDVGELSWNRYCGVCGPTISALTNEQLHYHTGEKFANWRRGMIRCAGGIVPERLDQAHEKG